MDELLAPIVEVYRSIYGPERYIPLHAPKFTGKEKEYVDDCVDTGWVSSVGKYVTRFADELARYSGASFCVPVVNGTSGLHLALNVLGVGPGDEVLCPDLSFIASAASIIYCGADPVLLDVSPETLGLSSHSVKTFLERETRYKDKELVNRHTGKVIKACMIMHNVGFPAEIQEILGICQKYELKTLEDAAESLGASVGDQMTGTFADFGVYSFNGNKIITTGGGGALVTADQGLYETALHLSQTAKVDHPYRYDHDAVGFNYRMPNINAALGLAQLERMESILARKADQHAKIAAAICTPDLKVLNPPMGLANRWFVVAKLATAKYSLDTIINELQGHGIMSRPLWSTISSQKPYSRYMAYDSLHAAKLAESVICLPNGLA